MKILRLSLSACTFTLLLFSALPASGGMCSEACSVFILPDSAEVPLPLDDWMVPAGTPADTIKVIEAPRFGFFSTSTQVYSPSSDFWRLGLDRLVVKAPGLEPKALILIAASPVSEIVAAQDLDGYSLRLDGAEGEIGAPLPVGDGGRIVTAGAGVTASPGVPCPNGCLTAPEPTVLQAVEGLFVIELRVVEATHYVRARATHPGFQCGGETNCATPFVPIPIEERTRLEAKLGASSYFGPANGKFSLRFNVTPESTGVTRHYEVGNLNPVPLTGTHQLASGLIGAAPFYAVEIDDLSAWLLREGAVDMVGRPRSDRFEAPAGYEEFWTRMGSVNLVRQGGSKWISTHLAGLTPSWTSCSSVMDDQVGSHGQMRLTFTLDVQDLNLEYTDNLVIFAAQGNNVAGTNRVFDLFVRTIAGVPSIRARALSDNGTVSTTDWLPLDTGASTAVIGTPNTITAQFRAGAGDGFLRLQVNQSYVEANGISNGSRKIDNVSFGACMVNVAWPTASRTLRYDNIATVY